MSDGKNRPWPWTVNFGGQGHFFASSAEAELAVAEREGAGTTNFDVGCFQINRRWHGAAFSTISAMFDPDSNALYAAQFLAQLHTETGSWPDAAAAYHSRTPEYAERYRVRFEDLHNGLADDVPMIIAEIHRENQFPLLKPGAAARLGSIVPDQPGGISLIGRAP